MNPKSVTMKTTPPPKTSHAHMLLRDFTAALIALAPILSFEIPLASLIFANELAQFLPQGIALFLLGSAVITITTSALSRLPTIVSYPQDTPSVILAIIAADIAAKMGGMPPQAIYSTLLVAIAITSMLTGASFLLLGYFKASKLIRFIPYPVMGGFMAGCGWLLVKGAFALATTSQLNMTVAAHLFDKAFLAHWVPTISFAIILLLATTTFKHYACLPLTIFLAIAFFYGMLMINGLSIDQATAHGWLFSSFPAGQSLQPLTYTAISQVDWWAVAHNLDNIAIIIVLSIFSMLLNTVGIEVTTQSTIDLDRQLVAVGSANLIGGSVSSPVGYQAIMGSILAYQAGAQSFMINIFLGLFFLTILSFGITLIAFVPKFILAGILMFMGLSLLIEWLWSRHRHLLNGDFFLIAAIVLCIACFGIFQGIISGLVIAALIFTVNYSRISAIKSCFDGSLYRSKISRSKMQRSLLQERGGEIMILQLEGFIFFGSMTQIQEKIYERLKAHTLPPLRSLIIDCHRVSSIDSSAGYALTQLLRSAHHHGMNLVWANIPDNIRADISQSAIAIPIDPQTVFPSLDFALEWCENRSLEAAGIPAITDIPPDFDTQIQEIFPTQGRKSRLIKYVQKIDLAIGDTLIREGESSQDLYFIASGLLSVQRQLPNGQLVRLHTMCHSSVIGELNFYIGGSRSADVVAIEASTVYRLPASRLAEMKAQDPEFWGLLNQWIATLLAERLLLANRTIEVLLQ
jgi:SulP family sulfate permease